MDLISAESSLMVREGKKGREYGPLLVNPYLVVFGEFLNEKEYENPYGYSLERAL